MNASMNIESNGPLHVYRDVDLYGGPRIFISTLGGAYFALNLAEAKHIRDRLGAVLSEVAAETSEAAPA